ncbi:hypothetical protein Dsin_016689 [Dipteronia sinensis]|uniref:Plastocyanin-like domain-containing protein n=1 Tax=Dipteronia sinensis TaxID=43782 RepID=A0AAE0AEC2_9ROSI|nr:hypothetical protein Dsin_016689 [Dipteronia sinensis]
MEGDTIIVNVINKLFMENVAVHWHGIRQMVDYYGRLELRGWMEHMWFHSVQRSPVTLSQFTYQFVADRVAVAGGKSEPFSKLYHEDHSIVLADWYHSISYRLKFNSVVDVILQNANTMSFNHSETHPWHLHGHDFWVLGYGDGKFNMETDVNKYNLDDPIMKNTVPMYPYGWTALRFQADNPGIWLFHCHIEVHYLLGMHVMFESGSAMVAEPPQQNMGCGKTKSLIK